MGYACCMILHQRLLLASESSEYHGENSARVAGLLTSEVLQERGKTDATTVTICHPTAKLTLSSRCIFLLSLIGSIVLRRTSKFLQPRCYSPVRSNWPHSMPLRVAAKMDHPLSLPHLQHGLECAFPSRP